MRNTYATRRMGVRDDRSREKGLPTRAIERIGAEIGQRVETEIREMKRDLAREKKALQRMMKEQKKPK